MPYDLIGAGGLTVELKQFYNRKLLMRALPKMVFAQFGRKDGIPRNNGKSLEWRRFERPAVSTTTLTEGTPGASLQLTVANVAVTVDQYGRYNQFSDLVNLQSYDPWVANQSEMFSELMALTVDTVVRDVVTAGTTQQFANGATSRGDVGSGDRLDYAAIRRAVATLRRSDAVPFDDGLYVGFAHPDSERDLFADPNVQNALQHGAARGEENPLFKGSIGAFHGVRWFITSQANIRSSAGLSGADVYDTVIIGKEYYGVVDYDAMPPRIIVKQVGSGGTSDPLDQLGTIGFKVAVAAARLNNNFAVRIEHSTSQSNAA